MTLSAAVPLVRARVTHARTTASCQWNRPPPHTTPAPTPPPRLNQQVTALMGKHGHLAALMQSEFSVNAPPPGSWWLCALQTHASRVALTCSCSWGQHTRQQLAAARRRGRAIAPLHVKCPSSPDVRRRDEEGRGGTRTQADWPSGAVRGALSLRMRRVTGDNPVSVRLPGAKLSIRPARPLKRDFRGISVHRK